MSRAMLLKCGRGHENWRTRPDGGRECRDCEAARRRRRTAAARTNSPRRRPGRGDCIPVGPIRELVERQMARDPDLTWCEVALRCGWTMPDGQGDTTRVLRRLGMRVQKTRVKGKTGLQSVCSEFITEDAAVKIGRAVHLDPWELGL